MIKKELQKNLPGFIIWSSILVALFVFIFVLFPSIVQDTELINELMKTMDPTLLAAFNLDITGFDSTFSWIATEGHVFLLLLGSIYFALLGSNLLLKEENDLTIEFLYSKNISRDKIFLNKLITGYILAILFNMIIYITLLLGLILSNDLDFTKLNLLILTSLFIDFTFISLTIYISTFLKKTNKSTMISLGVVFGFYLLHIISQLSEKVEFLKFFSPFHYTNARSIIKDNSIPIENIIILLVTIEIINILSYIKYKKKELI